MSGVEIGVIGGALVFFAFLPGALSWMEYLQRRRAERAMRATAAANVSVVTSTTSQAADASWESLPLVVGEGAVAEDVVEVAPAPQLIEPKVEPKPELDVVAPAAEKAAVVDEAKYGFHLEDLRHARVLETPPREVLNDPAGQQQWEAGLRLAETHAAQIGGTLLSASFEPQARCFAGMRDLGEAKELRFLLFSGLWPTSIDQAAAEALFEINDAGLGRAYVVRRA